jgi:hypothetical protein
VVLVSAILLAANTLSLYRRGTDNAENTALVLLRGLDNVENTSTVGWSGPHRKHLFCCIVGHVCVAGLFTEPLPSNALSKPSHYVNVIVPYAIAYCEEDVVLMYVSCAAPWLSQSWQFWCLPCVPRVWRWVLGL